MNKDKIERLLVKLENQREHIGSLDWGRVQPTEIQACLKTIEEIIKEILKD